jgi:lysozyme
MKISAKGIKLIKELEGNWLTAYQCPAGVWTIGVGHTGKVGLKKICKGMKITDKQSTALLKSDIKSFEKAVNTYVLVKLTQNQFDALVSFAFNEGAGNLKKSTLLKMLNDGDYTGASKEFLKWNKADIDNDGELEVLNG